MREVERLKSHIKSVEDELLWYKSQYPGNSVVNPIQTTDSPGQNSVPGLEWSSSRTTHSSPEMIISQKTGYSDQGSPWEGIQIGTARSPNSSWYGASSLFYFIGRMNNYLGAILQQTQMSNQMVLHGTASTLLNGTMDGNQEENSAQQAALSAEDPFTAGEFLSSTQEEYFLDLFWKSYHTCLFPIVNEAEFMAHYQSLWAASEHKRKPCALVDIMVAICMQYGVSQLDHQQQKSIIDGDPSVAGRWYFRRCQQIVMYQLESPTISTVQALMLCCIYLCNGSFQNMSATMGALAARAAYAIGLHVAPSPTLPAPERELRKRLWWALYELDAKVGMKLGRPFLLSRSATEPELPDDQPETAKDSGSHLAHLGDRKTWLSFHLYSTKLFILAREIHEKFYERDLNLTQGQVIWDHPQLLESHAEFVQAHAGSLYQWVDEVPNALKTDRKENGTPFSTDGTKLNIEPFSPIWLQRQRLVLELIYHNLSINIHRPFISFTPGPTLNTTENMATKCALHAMALINIIHQTLSSTTILNGWHEAFQWQWNASMTIVGFVLAYPRGALAPKAIQTIELSIAVCEIFGEKFAVANSAATILRNLGPKISFLQQYHPDIHPALQGAGTGQEMPTEGMIKPTAGTEWLDNLMGGSSELDSSLMMPMQDMFQMAYSIEQWIDLDNLLPTWEGESWTMQGPGLGAF
ncbi:hypothetical protein N7488_005566 [Penicillium malachiteum]|nr:hypothetical protein N7488_005566 [Penicillium malachiteum]